LSGDRDAVLSALLVELDDARPTMLVLEDVPWADDATLDVLRYVGRRVADLPALVIATYRDKEVGPTAAAGARRARWPPGHRLAQPGCPGRGGAARQWHRRHFGCPVPALSRKPFGVTVLVAAAEPGEAVPRCSTRCWRGSGGSTRRSRPPTSS
jgi:hypothetical protein